MAEQTDTPLIQCEKESEILKKEIEEKLKIYSKIDLKSSNKDKDVYKKALDDAIKSTYEHLLIKCYFTMLCIEADNRTNAKTCVSVFKAQKK